VTTTDTRRARKLQQYSVWFLAVVAVAALAGCCQLPRAQAPLELGWETLFDGQTLNGWKASENPASFAVRDGMIVVHGSRAHLFYVGTGAAAAPVFTDFDLKAEILTLPRANSGVFIHTAYQDTGWPAQGIEVQVNNTFPADPKRTGSLYNLVNTDSSPVTDEVWWEMHIAVRGKHVVVKINGQLVADYNEPPERTTEPRLGSGTFALQAHDPESEVHYRNVRVRPVLVAAAVPVAPGAIPVVVAAAPAPGDLFDPLLTFDYAGPRQALTAVEDRLATATPEEFAGFETRLLAILEAPTVTPAGRQLACRLLLRVGSDACVAPLAKLLTDPELSHPARCVLERLGSPTARQALRESLERLAGPQQIGVLHSLGNTRDAESVPRLIDLAGTPDASLAEAALRALGAIGGAQAMTALQSARSAAPAERRQQVTNALLRALEQTDSPADRDAVLTAYRALFAAAEPMVVRVAALEGLVRLEGERALPLILQTLEDPAPELQGVAAQYVRTLPGPGITAAFAARLAQADAGVQVSLLAALADRGDVAAKAAVLEALRHPDRQVREAAAAALEKLGSAADVEPLGLAIGKARGPERDALCGVLSRLPGDDVGPALLAAVGNADPGVRSAAIRALTIRREPGAGPRVLEAGSDTDAGVRREACAALPDLVGMESLPRVIGLLVAATADADREAVRDALTGMGTRATTPDRGADTLASALLTATAPGVRVALLRSLGKLGGPTALWAVQSALTDPDPVCADAALRALCDWPDQTALERLLALAATAPVETHRVLALRAAVRLLGLNGPVSRDQTLAYYRKALELATRPDERKAVLGGLAGVADPRAGELIQPELDNDAVRNEAAIALLTVARRILGIDLDQARAFAGRAKQTCPVDTVQREAEAVLKLATEMADYAMSWQVAGPYAGVKREELFATVFPPEEGKEKPEEWKPMPVGTQPDKPWLLDLKQTLTGEDRVAYLRAYVSVGRDLKARLDLGSDDGLKAWVNGRAVLGNPAWRGVKPGDDQVPISLQTGWNTILLKVVQGGGDWGACARLVDRDGKPIEGLKVKATLSAEESKQLVTAPAAELVLHWPLDSADNATTPDVTGAAGAGAVGGGAAVQPGLVGNCLVFDGVDDEVWLKSAKGLPLAAGDAWSINAFVWVDQPLAELTIVGGFGDVVTAEPKGCQRYLINLHKGIHFWGSAVDVNAGLPFDVGGWQMATITYDGTQVALYKNGKRVFAKAEKLEATAAVVALAPADHWKKGTRFAGKLDEFSIWRGALTQDQINGLAAALAPKAQ
jgi:HEAT repeat protein